MSRSEVIAMKRIKLKPTVMDLLFLLLIAVSCLYLYFGYTKSPTLADSYKELDIIIESEPIKRTLAEKQPLVFPCATA